WLHGKCLTTTGDAAHAGRGREGPRGRRRFFRLVLAHGQGRREVSRGQAEATRRVGLPARRAASRAALKGPPATAQPPLREAVRRRRGPSHAAAHGRPRPGSRLDPSILARWPSGAHWPASDAPRRKTARTPPPDG